MKARTHGKTIGLIGGMGRESPAHHYRIGNRRVRDTPGGVHRARSPMYSADFGGIEAPRHAGDIVLGPDTMHRMAGAIAAGTAIPALHIADPTAQAIVAAGHTRIGLLGTAFTMEQGFCKGRLADRSGLEILIPDTADRATVHDIIHRELVAARIEPASRAVDRGVIARRIERGTQAPIVGCTENMRPVDATDSAVPLFHTTALHAQSAVDRAPARSSP